MNLHDRIIKANSLLAPYAVPHGGTLGRTEPEPEDETRFAFQRDRDRIIHSHAFRRLQGKTQVFVAGEGDHYRTRLTHTVEVAQIARDVARTLQLNEDLAECIALAHDLGHPPFGHAGETALDEFMQEHGASFEHNRQSLRIVTLLEEHARHAPGLNLNREVLEGIQKHEHLPFGMSLEAQVTDVVDAIAYLSHDTDDGLRADMFSLSQITHVPLAAQALERTKERGTFIRGALIHLLVTDLRHTSMQRIQASGIRTIADVYAHKDRIISLSETMQQELNELRRFLRVHMYEHPTVEASNAEGQHIIHALCKKYIHNPHEKILHLQKRTASTLPEAVKDYVAGMTDTHARRQIPSTNF
ncbi:MAG: dGTPase [Candidatus Peribacteria bacterium]|nr:dGTPase [Candidatus Peribacteria bacterium]